MRRTDLPLLLLAVVAFAALLLPAAGCREEAVRRGPLDNAPQAAGNGDTVYAADLRGRVHAVNGRGAEIWVYSLGDALRAAAPPVAADIELQEIAVAPDGSVLLLARSVSGTTAGTAYLAAVRSEGGERWHRSIDQPTSASRPIAVGRDVYVAGLDGSLRAYALADGRDLWRYGVSGAELGSPRVGGDGTIFVRGARGRVHALAPDGTETWSFDPE